MYNYYVRIIKYFTHNYGLVCHYLDNSVIILTLYLIVYNYDLVIFLKVCYTIF